jgi:catechol 2,3-dioxygenase-like lactoylglutathione lyase family enzyme
MMKVYKISAVTLLIKDMERSCNFYSKIPGFKLVYGGSPPDPFTSYEIGDNTSVYLNLELFKTSTNSLERETKDFGLIFFENEPSNASWGERYFHIRDPDGYLLSFAKSIKNKNTF